MEIRMHNKSIKFFACNSILFLKYSLMILFFYFVFYWC